jgi:hypothetical protein
MRVSMAVMLLTAATPWTLLTAQSTGARRPAPTADTRRPVTAPATKTPAAAVAATPARASTESHTSIGLRVGTLGVGAELSHLLGDHVGLRLGASYLKASHTHTRNEYGDNSVRWDITAKGNAFSGVLDFYPGKRGVFRLSAGAMSAPGRGNGVGVILNDSSYNLYIHSYPNPRTVIGNFIASGGFASVLPYVGIGFGTPASQHRGVGFICDIGAAIGRPTVALTSTAAATTTNPTLRQDLLGKQREWQTETLDKIPIYPVLNLGVAYRF